MAEDGGFFEQQLVAGRECGDCNACCIYLTINDTELQKVQGVRCHNALPDNRCTIYQRRPHTCRTYYCGWRLLKWVRTTMRPDVSNVLVRLQHESKNSTSKHPFGVIFTLLNRSALKAEGLAESIAAGVAADVPVYLNIPGPPGYTSGQARINEVVADAVLLRDKPALLRILRQAHSRGRHGNHRKIVLKTPVPGGGTAGTDA